MTNDITALPQITPAMLSLLPMFYVGWSDSVLSPSEIQLIHDKIRELDYLSESEQDTMIRWIDPAKPPAPETFQIWVNAIRKYGKTMPVNQRLSLGELGLMMAKAATQNQDRVFDSPKVRKSLMDIEQALGIKNEESYRIIYRKINRNKALEQDTKAEFSIEKLTRLLDDDYHEIRNRLRRLLMDPVFRYRYTRAKDIHRQQVLYWAQLLAQQGFGALSYPNDYGGADSMGQFSAIFETLAHHDLSLVIKFGVQFGLFGGAVLHLGTEKHHQKYLSKIGKLEIPGCFAMTETGHGSNVRGLETTAVYDLQNQEFVIHSPTPDSSKEYIGNALHGKIAVVFAQLHTRGEAYGVHAFMVPLRDDEGRLLPGIRIEDNGYKMGLNGVDNGKIWFDQIRIPLENMLDKYGSVATDGTYSSPISHPSKRFFTMLSTLVGGRICVARAGLSAAKSGLAIAIKYGFQRRQFGPAQDEPETRLMTYPTHQWRLMLPLATAYALDFALTHLTKQYEQAQGGDLRQVETDAAGLKAYATWYTTRTLQICREACGGKGYLYENRFADLKADTDIFTTFEGDNTVLLQLVAKSMLTNFKQQLNDDGYLGIMKLLSRRVTTSIVQLNPMVTRRTDVGHLRDQKFQLDAFTYREQKLLYTLAQRMRKYLKRRVSPFEAFLRCQMHMLETANAYVEKLILINFQSVVVNQKDPALKKVLQELCDLFALHTIYENRGWYLENDYLQGNKAKAIRRLISKLCNEVKGESQALVQAFGIPDTLLGAPIAT